MVRLRQALAFPMYAASAWLVWVLTQEAGPQGLIAVLAAMILVAFAAWAWGTSRHAKKLWHRIGTIAAMLALIAGLSALSFAGEGHVDASASSSPAGIASTPYSEATLATLRGEHKPIFVDATAAWCITCLVNEKVALSGTRVRDAFKTQGIAYLVADWTNRDPAVTRLLEAHGRTGVPLYLYFAPGAAEPKILPQILTEDEVLSAIGGQ
jgi:thiol:disulfide interchange protein DsbD